jgi:carboxyl-terminal processing protease
MAEEKVAMSSRTRRLVLVISAPVVAFAIIGGFLNKVVAREDTYPQLRIFQDIVGLITANYVDPVNVDKVMTGAMHGLAESLDPDSAFLNAEQVGQMEASATVPPGEVGLDLTRQYYLRVIAARDGSPAAKAGLRTGDYVRVIGETPTREMSVYEGMRRLRGAPGSKVTLTVIRGSTADPHIVELTREPAPSVDVTGRMAGPGIGYLRVAAVSPQAAAQAKARIAELVKAGATRLIVDVRRASGGAPESGIALARLFVANGTLAVRETRGSDKVNVPATAGDGGVTLPTTLLIDTGTSGAAELFAASLMGNQRADSIGERTIGRAAIQKLVKLPDGTGLWLTTTRFLTPNGTALHGKGLEPTIAVDEPDVEFGQPPPATDVILEKALEVVGQKKAA